MAPSGGGKTTLLRVLMGLEAADSGTVEGLAGLRQSAVFQEDRLCEALSAAANIRLVNPALSGRGGWRRLFQRLDLPAAVIRGWRSSPAECAAGVAILRALLARWDVLFLDEPFKGLDAETKALVLEDTRRRLPGANGAPGDP